MESSRPRSSASESWITVTIAKPRNELTRPPPRRPRASPARRAPRDSSAGRARPASTRRSRSSGSRSRRSSAWASASTSPAGTTRAASPSVSANTGRSETTARHAGGQRLQRGEAEALLARDAGEAERAPRTRRRAPGRAAVPSTVAPVASTSARSGPSPANTRPARSPRSRASACASGEQQRQLARLEPPTASDVAPGAPWSAAGPRSGVPSARGARPGPSRTARTRFRRKRPFVDHLLPDRLGSR